MRNLLGIGHLTLFGSYQGAPTVPHNLDLFKIYYYSSGNNTNNTIISSLIKILYLLLIVIKYHEQNILLF